MTSKTFEVRPINPMLGDVECHGGTPGNQCLRVATSVVFNGKRVSPLCDECVEHRRQSAPADDTAEGRKG